MPVHPRFDRLVVTNGCFDLLHVGHVKFLWEARKAGDYLLVGLNDDESVRGLKGDGRPVYSVLDRAEMLAALRPVSAVCIFSGMRATEFLKAARPDVYVKGGDYTIETLDPDERAALGVAEMRFIPLTPGVSTTNTITRTRCQAKPS